MQAHESPLVSTIKERCRVCFTCVRECPAKAIRIVDQQAEVIAQRCIACGNCVRVCSQDAKRVASSIEPVEDLLAGDKKVAAIIAPSWPAEFTAVGYETMVGMIRALGFDLICEVSFGADLVAASYRYLLEKNPDKRYIATSCPAIVGYVERYHPDLVEALAPIVSPMIASARVLHRQHGDDLQVVFIGPCIAKKGESDSDPVRGDVTAALTFRELRDLFEHRNIKPDNVTPSEFDPPHGSYGGLFPISRGMLQAAHIEEDLAAGEVVAADGHAEFIDAIREFQSGDLDVQLLECLCCNGCIMGPGFTDDAPLFRRRAGVSRYVRERLATIDRGQWKRDIAEYLKCNLARTFIRNDQRVDVPSENEVERVLRRMGKRSPRDELNCGACGYDTCREHAVAILKGLAESEMCLPFTIEELRKTCSELQLSNEQLASMQEALMQSEKLASMGQLAAGIAHEVNNPLGTVLMLSHVLLEETPAGGAQREDLELMVKEADRCKKIVSGLLQFARKNRVDAEAVDIGGLVEQVLHGLPQRPEIKIAVEHQTRPLLAEIDRDQIVQVITNLVTNATAAMPEGGTLTLHTHGTEHDAIIAIGDTGVGIPEAVRGKIFEPFFTTKPAGEGTGLGLSVSYGIVKMHHGDIRFESNADPQQGATGTTFTVRLPRQRHTVNAAGLAGM